MKCVKHQDGFIDRVTDEEAQKLVNSEKASFVPKKVWKEEKKNVR